MDNFAGSSNGRTHASGACYLGPNPSPAAILRQGFGMALAQYMYYAYILFSSKSKNFYFGYTEDLRKRVQEHNNGISKATAPYIPWKLVFYSAFDTMRKAKDFELYLKTGSGKAFAYKHLLNSEVLKKDKLGKLGVTKL